MIKITGDSRTNKYYGKSNGNSGIKTLLAMISLILLAVIVVTIYFSARYVFDCINVESSINVKTRNKINYSVYLIDNEFYSGDEAIDMSNDRYYFLDDTVKISVVNNFSVELSKELFLVYKHEVTKKLVVKTSSSAGGSLVWTKDYDTTQPIVGTDTSDSLENKVAFDIYLADCRSDFDDYAVAHSNTRLAGELVIEFKTTIRNNANEITSVTTRGLNIPFTNEPYKISLTGQELIDKDYPERVIQFPKLEIAAAVIIGLVFVIIMFVLSVRGLFLAGDPYKRSVNRITRKFNDEIVIANKPSNIYDYPVVEVKHFKELLKFSQNLNKPIVHFEKDEGAVFFILCDNMIYQYFIRNKVKTAPEPIVEKGAGLPQAVADLVKRSKQTLNSNDDSAMQKEKTIVKKTGKTPKSIQIRAIQESDNEAARKQIAKIVKEARAEELEEVIAINNEAEVLSFEQAENISEQSENTQADNDNAVTMQTVRGDDENTEISRVEQADENNAEEPQNTQIDQDSAEKTQNEHANQEEGQGAESITQSEEQVLPPEDGY